jgi:polyketide synthase 12/myxalamid-type polyketide synthase MxaB
MAGVGTIQPEEGLRALELLMTGSASQAGVVPIDWTVFARQFSSGVPPFLSEILQPATGSAAEVPSGAADAGVLLGIKDAPASEQLTLLADFVRARAIRVLGIDAARYIDPRQPLNELGLDSLMAVELRNALGVAAGRTLPSTLLFDYPTLDALAGYLANHVLQLRPPDDTPAENETDGLDDLSEDDMAALLSQELAAMRQKRTAS